ncbi:dTMP kinase [bacterium]|nr:dTMP kinase [Gemmatimonadota bacterium]MCH2664312.1 dTMP kinase [bacterium]HCK11497.1 dTMP kinase [Candidatus Latescibacterota bacterium]
MRGLFITFEGIEHCGKTTQSRLIADRLRNTRRSVVLTREPGGTPLGTAIRELVLQPSTDPIDTTAELLLFAADRAQHVRTLIQPALADGKVVISDRFHDSTRAYQGYGRGIDMDTIDRAISLATGGLEPDLTILMDVDVETSRARAEANDDRIEQDSNAFFDRVRHGFLEIARNSASRIIVVNGTEPTQDVTARVADEVDRRLASLAD